jgi:hypothetical protein
MYNQNHYSPRELNYLKQLAADMKELKTAVQDLRENRVKPDQVYTREVVDGFIKELREEMISLKALIKEDREQLYKMLTIIGGAVTLVILIAQHVVIH